MQCPPSVRQLQQPRGGRYQGRGVGGPRGRGAEELLRARHGYKRFRKLGGDGVRAAMLFTRLLPGLYTE